MADDFYVNGRSVFHAGSSGKAMACFPDVCLCPPPPPAGPIPTPLPNNAMASDVTDCAQSVLYDGNPVATKKSHISKSTGDEAGKPQGGGVVTHVTNGKAYFVMGSFDVLIEGEMVPRHLDMTTHNHASPTANTPPWVVAATQALGTGEDPCGENCKLSTKKPNNCPDGPDPRNPGKTRKMTPHHIMPGHCFKNASTGKNLSAWSSYNYDAAPCICVTGQSQHEGQHKEVHDKMDGAEYAAQKAKGRWTYSEAKAAGTKSVCGDPKSDPPTPATLAGCAGKEACIEAALDTFHLGGPEKDKPNKASQNLRADAASEDPGSRSNQLMQQHIQSTSGADAGG